MDFTTAWDTLEEGAVVEVSSGRPPPSTNVNGRPYKVWRSNNFTGLLYEKVDGEWRKMRFMLIDLNEHGNSVGYTVVEGFGHSFTEVQDD